MTSRLQAVKPAITGSRPPPLLRVSGGCRIFCSVRSFRPRALAGVVAPVFASVALTALSIARHRFLNDVGWSAVHRTRVEWPSLLELGDIGWLTIALFILVGVCGVALATAIWQSADVPVERVVAVLIALMSVAIALEGFRPDLPSPEPLNSWHNTLHNAVFPAIPATSLLAASSLAYAARRVRRPYLDAVANNTLLTLMGLGLVLTAFGSIAQLARYLYFGALLVWIELLALGVLRRET